MKVNKWTLGLAAVGLVGLPAPLRAEEKMNQVWTALSSTTISGYVNTSIHWNTGTGNGTVPGYVYNSSDKQDGFNLNVVDLTIEKAMDEAQWAAGYKVQLWIGPDAATFGTANNISKASLPDDFTLKQAYVGLRTPVGNGLDFKIGVFDGLLGYESHDSGKNPNYTRAYGLALTPHTHTGLEASYQFSKLVSFSAAIANTVGPIINQKANPPKAESFKAYTGALALSAPEEWGFLAGSTLYFGALTGYSDGADNWDQTSWYSGFTMNTPVNTIKVGGSWSYLGTTSFGGGADNYANAVALYASFQMSEKLSLHLRGEYGSTDTGLYGTGAALPDGNSEIFALTTTLQYDLWKNVISRLEFRWDHEAGDGDMIGYGGDPAFGGGGGTAGTKRNNVLIAANIIYQF